jgi:AcrR family transcriptional regulator
MRHHKSASAPVTLESVAGAQWWNPPTDARRLALTRSAYEIVVERGLEGLRTRAVAERSGVNIATLHYYYPSKEMLVAGVVGYLGSLFAREHAQPVVPSGHEALDRLRQEFADVKHYRTVRPDMCTAMTEFALRARRDPAIAGILNQLTAPWRAGLEFMVTAGIAAGTFRADVDPPSMVDLLQAAVTGLMYGTFSNSAIEGISDQFEQWMLGRNLGERSLSNPSYRSQG